MGKKGEVVKFPLGSSEDLDEETSKTLQAVVREGVTDVIVVGLDVEGEVSLVHSPNIPVERVHYLLSKALKMLADEPLDMDLYDDEGEEDDEEESVLETE
jgi:hypothetical protein